MDEIQPKRRRVCFLCRSLAAKIIVSLALLLAVSKGVQTALEIKSDRSALEAAKVRAVKREAEIVRRSMAHAMLEARREDMDKIVEAVGQQPGTLSVRIIDESGTVKVAADRSQVGTRLELSGPECTGCHAPGAAEPLAALEDQAEMFRLESGGRAVRVIRPIQNSPECFSCHEPSRKILGLLGLTVSLDDVDAIIAEKVRTNIIYAVVTVAVMSLAASALILVLVRNPMDKLVRVMRKMESGDFNARVDLKREDELGKLGESFNAMASSLEVATTRLEQQVSQADKLASLGELVAGIAHELKNPLAGIAAATQVLDDDFEKTDPRKDVTQQILVQVGRLDRIVKDFLRFARPSLPRFSWNDMNEVLQKTTFFVRKSIQDKRGVLEEDYAEGLPKVHVDPDKMQQAFLGLLLNAAQAIGEGGRVRIRTRSDVRAAGDAGAVTVEISDDGVGIPEQNLKKIFDPFFTTKHHGTGLGLAIVREIAAEHGGTLLAGSEPGEGTTFTVRIPVQSLAPRREAPDKSAGKGEQG